jgi:hypothetical protein
MADRRELEGIGYHYYDGNDDCLLVSQWIKRPEDLTGQAVPVSKLLPRGVRCGLNNSQGGYGGTLLGSEPAVTFKFRITVEIEKLRKDEIIGNMNNAGL